MIFCPFCGEPITDDYCEVCPWCFYPYVQDFFHHDEPKKQTPPKVIPRKNYDFIPQEEEVEDRNWCFRCFLLVAGIIFIFALYLLYKAYY